MLTDSLVCCDFYLKSRVLLVVAASNCSSKLTLDAQWLRKTRIYSSFMFCQLRLLGALPYSAVQWAKRTEAALSCDCTIWTTWPSWPRQERRARRTGPWPCTSSSWKWHQSHLRTSHWLEGVMGFHPPSVILRSMDFCPQDDLLVSRGTVTHTWIHIVAGYLSSAIFSPWLVVGISTCHYHF